MDPSKVTPEQVKSMIDVGERVTFLDDRSPDAWNASDVMIRGAHRVPLGEVEQHLAELTSVPKNSTIVTYCT